MEDADVEDLLASNSLVAQFGRYDPISVAKGEQLIYPLRPVLGSDSVYDGQDTSVLADVRHSSLEDRYDCSLRSGVEARAQHELGAEVE